MKKKLIVCLIFSICFMTSCSTTTNVQQSSDADIDTSVTEVSTELSMNNLLMTIECTYLYRSQVKDTFFLMCVLSCGDVWAITADFKTYHMFDTCDDSVWSLIPEPNYLGRLEAGEIATFTELISKVDINSEYYSRPIDETPNVEDLEYYRIHCYLPLKDGGRTQYLIKSYGGSSGTSDETRDANAIAALEIIQNSMLYEKWLETHVHFRWQEDDEWMEM